MWKNGPVLRVAGWMPVKILCLLTCFHPREMGEKHGHSDRRQRESQIEEGEE